MKTLRTLAGVMMQIGLMLMVFTLNSCDKDDTDKSKQSELATNYKKWQNASLSNYQFVQTINCYCSVRRPHHVTVINNAIDTIINSDGEIIENNDEVFKTIDELFQFTKTALDRNPHIATIQYNAQFGYPEFIYFDFTEYTADDEVGYVINDFTEQL